MTGAALLALLSHWRRHPFQGLALILGLGLATALWSGVQAINTEARASYARAADTLTPAMPVIRIENGTMSESDYVAMRRGGWNVTPIVDGWISGTGGRVRLLGIDPLTAPETLLAEGDRSGAGGADFAAFLTPPGRLLASEATAKRLSGPDLPPVIVSPDVAPGLALADIGIAQRLLGMEGQISRLLLLERQPKTRSDLSAIRPDLVIEPARGPSDLGRLTDSFHLNLTAFGFLSFAVGLLIVNGTIGLAFEQRRPLLRTLRALGVPARTLVLIAGLELLAFAVIAGAFGVALGYLIAALLIPDVAATLRSLYGVPVEGALAFRPSWWLAGLGIACAGTVAAGAGTLWKLATLPVLAPARPRAWTRAGFHTDLWRLGGALGLGVVALLAGTLGSGLVAGFTLLGALLLAAALVLPSLLRMLLGILSKLIRGDLAHWFFEDTRQQLPGLNLAMMALLLALAANIGVGTMVSSFRLTFVGWLDQRLASELYVTAEDAAQAARLQIWLAPRTEAVLPIWNAERDIRGAPAEIYGVADHATYRENWPILDAVPGVWDRVIEGSAVLINEQLARREALKPGDDLTLPGGWTAVIGGVYSDYGNPTTQVLMSIGRLTTLYPEVERLSFGLRLPSSDVPALARSLVEEFGLPPENSTDQKSLKAFSINVFERTFKVTEALNVLTLTVAALAITISLMTLAAMRLPQLAPAWAMGFTRGTLARLELSRALVLAALTAVLAIPVGLGLAWVLLAVINVEAFGWRLPMHVFPSLWIRLFGLALVAAALAAAWPALRLRRMDPSDLLRVFSNER